MSKNDEAERFAEEEFETPATVDEAFTFGRRSAFGRHPRLSFEQFFRYDEHPRPYGRSGLYRAYRKGFDQGKIERRQREEVRAIEELGRR